MSSTAKRNLLQMIALAVLVVGGYFLNGWVGALVGFGVFLVLIVVTTIIVMKKAGVEIGDQAKRDAEAEEAVIAANAAGALETENTEVPEVEHRVVKAPQDHMKPKGKTRPKTSGVVRSALPDEEPKNEG